MSNLSTNDNFVTIKRRYTWQLSQKEKLQILKKLQLALFMNASHLMRFN